SGSWISYAETRLGQGREAARQLLKDNPDLCAEIEKKIRKKLGLLREDPAASAAAPGAAGKGEKEEEKKGRMPSPPDRPTRPPSLRA
ncbi:MAG TPA: DNA recombination/repair protein RecA, partial [Candidatus Polarisedimenticolia bacterium]|nr:DNA recombination/repair protein RecA [Candidatus Polarisedimenticolia bacterium]